MDVKVYSRQLAGALELSSFDKDQTDPVLRNQE